jgi:hypothetical protein
MVGLEEALEGEDDRRGIEGVPSWNVDALASSNVSVFPSGRGPPFGELRLELDAVAFVGHERLVHGLDDLGVLAPFDFGGIERGGVGASGPEERLLVAGSPGAGQELRGAAGRTKNRVHRGVSIRCRRSGRQPV